MNQIAFLNKGEERNSFFFLLISVRDVKCNGRVHDVDSTDINCYSHSTRPCLISKGRFALLPLRDRPN